MADTDWQELHFEPPSDTLSRFGYPSGSSADPAALESFHRHGDVPRWRSAIDGLRGLSAVRYTFDRPIVEIGGADELDAGDLGAITSACLALRPWRKGPFRLFGVDLDAEWRSDLKWSRVLRAVSSLEGHRVLDVGCGNGYYCLRALGAGAAAVLGVEPSPLFVLQFELLKRWLPPLPAAVLPFAFEVLPDHPDGFDTVFSMGLLYHRKAPLEHLRRLAGCLSEGGQLVLETLVVEPRFGPVLEPRGRYANMGNVWSIPSLAELSSWLERVGLKTVRITDVSVTSSEEQRATPWSSTHSLREALHPNDIQKTIEGYPAPRRAMVVARR
ncbi:MAG TPA: tRNA 5-methoxyuridine(34)/uridine 5-oxyacetic acid(34) synthase CmoB [Polyangiaceae bacterium]